ncbi:hypothetical protein CHI08_12555 [Peribacillus simplex]|nr:hypothetical protein CHI08_12555 [Peribacillus simplex]
MRDARFFFVSKSLVYERRNHRNEFPIFINEKIAAAFFKNDQFTVRNLFGDVAIRRRAAESAESGTV